MVGWLSVILITTLTVFVTSPNSNSPKLATEMDTGTLLFAQGGDVGRKFIVIRGDDPELMHSDTETILEEETETEALTHGELSRFYKMKVELEFQDQEVDIVFDTTPSTVSSTSNKNSNDQTITSTDGSTHTSSTNTKSIPSQTETATPSTFSSTVVSALPYTSTSTSGLVSFTEGFSTSKSSTMATYENTPVSSIYKSFTSTNPTSSGSATPLTRSYPQKVTPTYRFTSRGSDRRLPIFLNVVATLTFMFIIL